MFELSFMQNAFMAGFIVSILCPFIGLFIVLRRHSMIGDTLSHSSFAGVAIGLVAGTNPIITSFIFTSICAVVIEYLRSYYKKYAELVMSIVLTLSLGLAIILISSGKASAKVDSFLFGSILTVSRQDIYLIAIVGLICILCLLVLYNKLVYITSIRVMGILVVSSIMVVPVATAMQLKKGFTKTLIYAILFGVLDVMIGLVLSYYINSAPGGTIALTSVIFLLLTLIAKNIFHREV